MAYVMMTCGPKENPDPFTFDTSADLASEIIENADEIRCEIHVFYFTDRAGILRRYVVERAENDGSILAIIELGLGE